MAQPLNHLKESASQTAGPYVHIGCTPNFLGINGVFPQDLGQSMVNERTKGERITIDVDILDGTGTPLRDVLVEIWQADAAGLFNSPSELRGTADPNFTGWGRQPSNLQTGAIRFETIKPGAVPFKDGSMQAPHINFWIVARGINLGLNTRMYFGDEDAANATDPFLNRLEHQNRIPTLVAPRTGDSYAFTIRLQGDQETIFLDI